MRGLRKVLGSLNVRPFVCFALILAAGSLLGRHVGGLLSVLLLVTAGVVGVVVAVVVRTVGIETLHNQRWATAWDATLRRREAAAARAAAAGRNAA